MDFWNLENELTPSELAALQALYSIEPWGEDRADLRAAVNTTAATGVRENDVAKLIEALTTYLEVNRSEGRELTPDQAAKQGKAAFAKIGVS